MSADHPTSEDAPAPNPIGVPPPHLRRDLRVRFPEDAVVRSDDNFHIHEVTGTGSGRYLVYEGKPKLRRQPGLVERILANIRKANLNKDSGLHQTIEIVPPDGVDDTLYIVETRDGEPLSRLLETEDLSEDTAIALIRRLFKALEPIHEAGLVYGSLDLDQVRVSPSGTGDLLRLGGLYKIHDPAAPVNLGFDPQFNAPSSNKKSLWSAADDVYVVGMVFYRMILGRALYRRQFGSILDEPEATRANRWSIAHNDHKTFIDPGKADTRVSPEIVAFLRACLEFDETSRPRNAHDAVAALEAAVARRDARVGDGPFQGKVVVGPGDVIVEDGKKGKGLDRKIVIAGGASALVTLGLAAFFWTSSPDPARMAELRERQMEVVRLSRGLAEDGIERLNDANPARVAFTAAGRAFAEADAEMKARFVDVGRAGAKITASKAAVDLAATRFGEVRREASAVEKEAGDIAAEITRLLPANAESTVAAATLLEDVHKALGEGRIDAVVARGAEVLPGLRKATAAALAERTAADAARGRVETARAALIGAGIEALDRDGEIRREFTDVVAVIARAETDRGEMRWTDAAGRHGEAATRLEALSTRLRALAEGVASERRDVAERVRLVEEASVADAPWVDDFRRRTARIDQLVEAGSLDLAGAPLEELKRLAVAKSEEIEGQIRRYGALATACEEAEVAAAARVPRGAPTLHEAAQMRGLAEKAATEKRYDRAIALAEQALARLREITGTGGEAMQTATAARKEFETARAALDAAAIDRLAPDHALARRLRRVEERAKAAEAAFDERRWSDAQAALTAAAADYRSIAEGLAALVARVNGAVADLAGRVDELRRGGAEKEPDFATVTKAGEAVAAALREGRLDAAEATLDEERRAIEAIATRLPGSRRDLAAAAAELADARKTLAPAAQALAAENPIRTEIAKLERIADGLAGQEGQDGRPLSARIAEHRDLIGRYQAAAEALADLREATRTRLAAFAGRVEEAGRDLPADDGELAEARKARTALEQLFEAGRLDEVTGRLAAATPKVAAMLERARADAERVREAAAAVAQTRKDLLDRAGDWILDLASAKTADERAKSAAAAIEERRFAAARADLAEAGRLYGEVRAEIERARARAETARRAAGEARKTAEAVPAVAVPAFAGAMKSLEAGDAALAANRHPAAAEAYEAATGAFTAAIARARDNAARVVAAKAELARLVETSKSLSGLDDARLGEAEALLARPMDPVALAADETRAAYETVLTRLGTAVASLGAVKTEVDALRAEQSERRDAVVKAGGEASNAYAALEAAFETGAKAYDGRDWAAARAGYGEARRLIDVIRKEIDDKSILACPDPHGQHGSRLVRAGTYPAGTMSLAGRVAEDAQRVTRTPRSNAFVAIGTPFCVMLQQVTAGDYQAYVRDRHPPTFEHLRARLENPAQPSDPVVDVSKLDAEGFIAWLKERDGRTYILPTLDQVIATIAKGVQERIPELPNGVSDPYREWTRELCNNGEGVLVVGRVGSEDNRTYVQCLRPSERFDNIGFRLLVVR